MGDYKSQYERYYGNMRKTSPGPVPKRDSYDSFYGGRGTKQKNIGERFIKKIIFQLVGAMVLLVVLICIKTIPVEGVQDAYIVSKEALDKDFQLEDAIATINIPEVEEYKEIALDYIDEFKSTVTGEKTLKETIKEEYIVPTLGQYTNLPGENNGVVIYTEGEKDVMASFAGKVKEVVEEDDEKHIIIDHGKGIETYYGLLSKVDVKEGDEIERTSAWQNWSYRV